MTKITFHGAAGTVTGSRHLLDIHGQRVLIDCGLFQGMKADRMRNWEPFPVDPASINKVLLTHAHIDHSGFLPKICRDGFAGNVHCTYATNDLCEILLRDTAHLQEEDARWANKKGFSKHKPALPLFKMEDAEKCLAQFAPLYYGDDLYIDENIRVKFRDAGHILGASVIDIKVKNDTGYKKIVFSGDVGRSEEMILREPDQVFNVDYLILESTYGNRLHPHVDPHEELAEVINRSVERGGVMLTPAFSVGRTQTLLYIIRQLEEAGKIPVLDVFIDSPMAIEATKVFRKRNTELNMQTRIELLQKKNIFTPQKLHVCKSRHESKAINEVKENAIIISASGMATGGRILHHLTNRLPRKENTVLFVGYQAEGTRGRAILDGNETVKIHGQHREVRAQVESISGFSGHADYHELLAWLMAFNRPPEKVFLVHGNPEASASLAEKIREQFGWDVVLPKLGDSFELDI